MTAVKFMSLENHSLQKRFCTHCEHCYNDFVLLSGSSNRKLADDVGKILGKNVHQIGTKHPDKENRVEIDSIVRRRRVYVIQSTCPPDVNGYLFELCQIIRAAKKSSANEITAVLPYFGYARDDKMNKKRSPISAQLAAEFIIKAGADRIVSLDIHSGQSQGFVDEPWDNLYASYVLAPALREKKLENLVVVGPDVNAGPIAVKYSELLGFGDDVAIIQKRRNPDVSSDVKILKLIGDVEGRNALMVDDLVAEGNTVIKGARLLMESGALGVWAAATHGVLCGKAIENIIKSDIRELLLTDTIKPRKSALTNPKFKYYPAAPLVAETIKRIDRGDSISNLFL